MLSLGSVHCVYVRFVNFLDDINEISLFLIA